MTQQIKTPDAFNTVSDGRRLAYASTAIVVALLLALGYHMAAGTLVHGFETYVVNLLQDPTPRLHGVGGAFLMTTTFFEMLLAVKMAWVLAPNGTFSDLEEGNSLGLAFQAMTLTIFAVAGFIEGIVASPHMFDAPLSVHGTFAVAVLGAVLLPSLAMLFTMAVRSMWVRPHSAMTNMLMFSLFGILTILVPTMDILFAVLSLGLVTMSVVLLPLGYKFRCAIDGVSENWEHHYRRYDPIG